MATVTVNQTVTAVTSQLKLAAQVLQRFLRTPASKAATEASAAQAVDLMLHFWSGGYANSASGVQVGALNDFAPSPGAPTRLWSDSSGSRPGLDTNYARLDNFFAARPTAKLVFNLFDHPQVMLQGGTRSSGYMPWPPSSQWGGGTNGAGTLCSEIIARYGTSRIIGFEYGLEQKGVAGNTAGTDAFVAGYTAWATYMRANHPTMQLWYPHFNFFARWANVSLRWAAMDGIIAGGSTLESGDEDVISRLLLVDPTLVDAWTLDSSIVDYSALDTRRGVYATVEQKVSMPFHLSRVIRERMQASWGTVKPVHHIEIYVDVNQLEQDWMSSDQSAALSTAMMMWGMKAGDGYSVRWEPQGGTPGAESPTGDIASWWLEDGTVLPAYTQAKDLRNTFPPGTNLHPVTTDDSHIVAVAGGGKVYLLNTHSSSISVAVSATYGSLGSQSIPAYGYLIQNLPTQTGRAASPSRGSSSSRTTSSSRTASPTRTVVP